MSSSTTRNHDRKSHGHGKLAVVLAGATLALGGATTALAAQVPVLDQDGQFEQAVVSADSRQDYHRLYDQAERLDVEPKTNDAAQAPAPKMGVKFASLSATVATTRAKKSMKEAAEPKEPEFESPESLGVSQATLDAIASCESGGDPTIVDASGTYHGKYQFDVQTWASMGGSGLPSQAPEAEQDYRAALLYSQSGSSPWPVCGQ